MAQGSQNAIDDWLQETVLAPQKKQKRTRKKQQEIIEAPKKVSKLERSKRDSQAKRNENTLPKLEIVSVDYSFMSRKSLEEQSVCKIGLQKGKDITCTVDDPRLGTVDPTRFCGTCFKSNEECPGHYGYINLPEMLIHPLARGYVVLVLESVCNSCSQPLISAKSMEQQDLFSLSGMKRLTKIAELASKPNVRCQNKCPPNPKFKKTEAKSNNTISLHAYIGKEQRILTVPKVKNILRNISRDHARLLGFEKNNHPINFIIDSVPVIPPSARPDVIREGVIETDYITDAYISILKHGEKYILSMDDEIKRNEEAYEILFVYDHIILNRDKELKSTSRSSDKAKSIDDRFKHKDGLLRGALLGKRVDYTGRSPLGSNEILRYGEIAPPKVMRSVLTVPEIVTLYNYNYIQDLASNGKIEKLIKSTGDLQGRTLRFNPERLRIAIGDTVYRHSEDGDVVLFNRQPTLHKQSMLGYRTRFQDKASVGLHLSSTTGHNADFDGDEGNIHMLQGQDSITEAALFASAEYNIISGNTSSPIAGIIYNGASGGYLLSAVETLSEELVQKGLGSMIPNETDLSTLKARLKKHKIPENSGKGLISALFPEDFFYKKGKVKIVDGIFIEGRLTKKHVGPSDESNVIQSFWKWYGPKRTGEFITNANFLFNWYLAQAGLTVSINDAEIPENKRSEFLQNKNMHINNINDQIQKLPKLENPTPQELEDRESEIEDILRNGVNKANAEVTEILDESNNLILMMNSGAKGKKGNIEYLIGLLGQQFVNNRRPLRLVSGRKRWLSSFKVDDHSIDAQGFSRNSFFNGLDPDEFWAHQQASRIGLLSTAIKSVTGDTSVFIIENGIPRMTNIGDWIDEKLLDHKEAIKYHDERDANMELLDLSKFQTTVIQTIDSKGNLSWSSITNVTRHDPSKTVYKITTKTGRSVKVVESKSLLVWDLKTGEYVPKETVDISVGDLIPVSYSFGENFTKSDLILTSEFVLTRAAGFSAGTCLAKNTDNETETIPPDFFLAPKEFIKGLVDGFYSEIGDTTGGNISVSSKSKKLIEGMNILLSRFNILGDICSGDSYRLEIYSVWIKIFAKTFTLSNKSKQSWLNAMRKAKLSNQNFKIQEDTILDPIVSIEKMSSEEFPKVYDLTVPETKNFGLANGIQVYDTADIGDMQRKMVKAQEDLTVRYDGTVRNSIGFIFQMSFGDGFHTEQLVKSESAFGEEMYSFINLAEAVQRVNSEFKN